MMQDQMRMPVSHVRILWRTNTVFLIAMDNNSNVVSGRSFITTKKKEGEVTLNSKINEVLEHPKFEYLSTQYTLLEHIYFNQRSHLATKASSLSSQMCMPKRQG